MAAWIGPAIQAVGSIAGLLMGNSQNRQANAIKPQYVPYTKSKYAEEMYALARNRMNGRDAGINQAEANIMQNSANAAASATRNATNPVQALAMAAANQAQTDNAFAQLQMNEAQAEAQRFNSLGLSAEGMMQQEQMLWKEQLRKYLEGMTNQQAKKQAAIASTIGAMDSMTGAAYGFGAMNKYQTG